MAAEVENRWTWPRLGGWSLVALGLAALNIIARISWYPVVVSDYIYFVKPWFEELRTHPGLTAFGSPFADYAPGYLYLLKFLTVIPVSSLISAKTLSFAFDLLIAYFGYLILARTSRRAARKDILVLAALVLLSLPTVMMNSSLWGQSDSLYSAGVMATLYFMLAASPLAAAIAYGAAISFKAQALFFAPVFIGYFLRERANWKFLLIPPLLFVLSVIPAWIAGGSLGYWLFIYLVQAEKYPYLSVSAQSLFAFLQPLALSETATNIFFWLGLLAAAGAAAAIIYIMKWQGKLSAQFVVLISLASTLLIPYLLPRMHERYFYLADILSVLYAFFRPNRWFIPVLVVGTSLASYMPFLSQQVDFLSWAQVDLRIPAAILLIPIGFVLLDVWQSWKSATHSQVKRDGVRYPHAKDRNRRIAECGEVHAF
ncbi:DUF2029 domain-containing protein [Candidatus Kaiserbacteria bacterium]|nr:DUF2029 domain-containing protein [Candidatus Kaiserbacteria bacterium]